MNSTSWLCYPIGRRRDIRNKLIKAIEEWRASGPAAPPRAMVLEELPTPVRAARVRARQPQPVGRRSAAAVPASLVRRRAGAVSQHGSGRLELARAIVDRGNPLTARVLVNRVWLDHFGAALVGTPSDFGLRSEPPTHPELLDYLAWSFVDRRLVAQVAAPRRSCCRPRISRRATIGPSAAQIDPENAWLWKMNRRRLDFEATRDSLLGRGRPTRHHAGRPAREGDRRAGHDSPHALRLHRSLNLPGVFRTFDFPNPDATSPQRAPTTVPQQALFFMNNPFVIASAGHVLARADVAARADRDGKDLPAVSRWRSGREPAAEEIAVGAGVFCGDTAAREAGWNRARPGDCCRPTNSCLSTDAMHRRPCNNRDHPDPPLTRRELLAPQRHGLRHARRWPACWRPTDALRRRSAAGSAERRWPRKQPHFAGKAKRVVHLFMNGGPSQVDTFDPKPLLDKYHGKPLPTPTCAPSARPARRMRSPFTFQKYGQSGIEVSELFAKTAAAHRRHVRHPLDARRRAQSRAVADADELRRRPAAAAQHRLVGHLRPRHREPEPARLHRHVPRRLPDRRRRRTGGRRFCPGAYQGTYIDTQAHRHRQADREHPQPARLAGRAAPAARPACSSSTSGTWRARAARRRSSKPASSRSSWPTACRREATDAFDIAREPQHVRELYGAGVHGRQLLITRRLLERGVRFVQVWSGAGQPWDNHDNLEKQHRKLAGECDQPIAAFLTDLKQRGLLDSTLVMWGGEFGRTPVAELPQLNGRDHNHYGFSMWLAGGGVKGGTSTAPPTSSASPPSRTRSTSTTCTPRILHLLGFDHEQLTYRYAGRDFRLTDVHGKVVKELLG